MKRLEIEILKLFSNKYVENKKSTDSKSTEERKTNNNCFLNSPKRSEFIKNYLNDLRSKKEEEKLDEISKINDDLKKEINDSANEIKNHLVKENDECLKNLDSSEKNREYKPKEEETAAVVSEIENISEAHIDIIKEEKKNDECLKNLYPLETNNELKPKEEETAVVVSEIENISEAQIEIPKEEKKNDEVPKAKSYEERLKEREIIDPDDLVFECGEVRIIKRDANGNRIYEEKKEKKNEEKKEEVKNSSFNSHGLFKMRRLEKDDPRRKNRISVKNLSKYEIEKYKRMHGSSYYEVFESEDETEPEKKEEKIKEVAKKEDKKEIVIKKSKEPEVRVRNRVNRFVHVTPHWSRRLLKFIIELFFYTDY